MLIEQRETGALKPTSRAVGPGQFRAGLRIDLPKPTVREFEMLEDCTVSLVTERRISQPWGLAGGGPGAIGENWLVPGGDERRAERLPAKCTLGLVAGDVIRLLTPGGGGWGTG